MAEMGKIVLDFRNPWACVSACYNDERMKPNAIAAALAEPHHDSGGNTVRLQNRTLRDKKTFLTRRICKTGHFMVG